MRQKHSATNQLNRTATRDDNNDTSVRMGLRSYQLELFVTIASSCYLLLLLLLNLALWIHLD